MRTRIEVEADEEARFAPYALRSSASAGRRHPESDDPHRPAFARDRDRIVHSGAFRRLEHKTQVLLRGHGDLYRSRLTHSLEVAQIARSAARILRLNGSLVEALALAHDLGHPPFGHTGEEVLRDVMDRQERMDPSTPLGGFEHNVQALRVVDRLERPYPGIRGLNLCRETRESILKHGARKAGPLADGLVMRPQPWLEAQLVDLADSLAYHSHDLEDGLRFGVFDAHDLDELALWRWAREAAARRYPDAPAAELVRPMVYQTLTLPIHDLVQETARRLDDAGIQHPEEARELDRKLVAFSDEMREAQGELRRFLFHRFYRSPRVVRDRVEARKLVEELFAHLLAHPDDMRGRWGRPVDDTPTDELPARVVCDYVAGMTDRFCRSEHARLVLGEPPS